MTQKLTNMKGKYIIFIASVVITILTSQIIIQYDLRQQNEDAELINRAGNQRTLSQRISKLVMYLHHNVEGSSQIDFTSVDTLDALLNEFHEGHRYLLNHPSTVKAANTKKLLDQVTPMVDKICRAGRRIVSDPRDDEAKEAVAMITSAEFAYHFAMDHAVNAYQRNAEEKLRHLKNVELLLSVAAIIILIFEFLCVFMPSLKRLSASNRNLAELNLELTDRNKDLAASEEEIRAHLQQIRELQTNVETREKQYRELVEYADDIIYELDQKESLRL